MEPVIQRNCWLIDTEIYVLARYIEVDVVVAGFGPSVLPKPSRLGVKRVKLPPVFDKRRLVFIVDGLRRFGIGFLNMANFACIQ